VEVVTLQLFLVHLKEVHQYLVLLLQLEVEEEITKRVDLEADLQIFLRQVHIVQLLEELEIKEVFHLPKVILVEDQLLDLLFKTGQVEEEEQEQLEEMLRDLEEMV
jgi:hypothetical protein